MEDMCHAPARSFILARRKTNGILLCIGLQFMFLFTILHFVKIDIFKTETWLRTLMNISLNAAIYTIPLGVIIGVSGLICSEHLEAKAKYFSSRFAMFCSIFVIHNLFLGWVYTLFGGSFFFIFLSLLGGGYEKLSMTCKNNIELNCIVESHPYLVLCGFLVGYYFYLQIHLFESKHIRLTFPIIHQSKLLQIKSSVKGAIKQAMLDAVSPTLLFASIYYMKGEGVRDYLCKFFNLRVEDVASSTGFVNFQTVIYSWFLSFIFLFTMYTIKVVLDVSLTDRKAFPIATAFTSNKSITLVQAINMTEDHLVQCLGYRDLSILAESDHSRRLEIFSLSQPGGHSQNWNAIVEVCLKLINNFIADLIKATSEIPPPTDASKIVKSTLVETSPDGHNCSINKGIRNLSYQQKDCNQEVQNLPSHQDAMKKMFANLQEMLLKKPVISYVFGEIPDAKVRHILSNGQSVIWATQSLALLADASFREDTYGVLQKDLPAIVYSLIHLKQTLDKLQKSGSYKKAQRFEDYENKMKQAMKSAAKRSLYRITVTFGNYLTELPLSKDILQHVQNFILYRD